MSTKLLLVLAALLSHLEPVAGMFDRPVEEPGMRGYAHEPVASVQVELLPDSESAEQLADSIRERLHASGLGLEVLVEIIPAEPELPVSYRVVVGPFFEFEDAERARTELEQVGIHGFVREFEPVIGC